jgi:hypothetical protein
MRMLESDEPRIALPKGWPKAARVAVVHAAALAHFVMTHVRGWCADSSLQRVRVASECERLRSEVALLQEELRIKDARLARIPPQHRPHYPPVERLAILALKAARGWNLGQAAARFLLVPATIADWLRRTDEEGPDALIRLPTSVAPPATRPAKRAGRPRAKRAPSSGALPCGSRRRQATPTTASPTSCATSLRGSRRRSRRLARCASPTSWPEPGCISQERPSAGCSQCTPRPRSRRPRKRLLLPVRARSAKRKAQSLLPGASFRAGPTTVGWST